MKDMHEQIIRAFKASKLSIKALATKAEIPYASAHGMVNRNSDPRISTVSKVCDVLGLELRPKRRGR